MLPKVLKNLSKAQLIDKLRLEEPEIVQAIESLDEKSCDSQDILDIWEWWQEQKTIMEIGERNLEIMEESTCLC